MELIKNIILDIDNPVYTSIEAKQNDTLSRFIQFTLVNKGLPLDLTSHTVKIFGVKQDNTLIFNQVEIVDSLAGIIKVELTNQALSVPGTLNCELVIYGLDNSVLSSKLFNIMVTKSLRDDSAIESTNEFSALTQGISKLNTWDSQFEQKYNGLEAQYATDLTQVKSSLAESPQLINVKFPPIPMVPCKCDGTSDDTTTFNNIYNYAYGNGKSLFIPGVLRITSQIGKSISLNDNRAFPSIVGNKSMAVTNNLATKTQDGSVILYDGVGGKALNIENTNRFNLFYGGVIKDISIIKQNGDQSTDSSVGLNIEGCVDHRLFNVACIGFDIGLKNKYGWSWDAYGLICVRNNIGVLLDDNSNAIGFHGSQLHQNKINVKILSGVNILFNKVTFEGGNSKAVVITKGDTTVTPRNIHFQNCYLEHNIGGFIIGKDENGVTSPSPITNVSFDQMSLDTPNIIPFDLDNAEDISLENITWGQSTPLISSTALTKRVKKKNVTSPFQTDLGDRYSLERRIGVFNDVNLLNNGFLQYPDLTDFKRGGLTAVFDTTTFPNEKVAKITIPAGTTSNSTRFMVKISPNMVGKRLIFSGTAQKDDVLTAVFQAYTPTFSGISGASVEIPTSLNKVGFSFICPNEEYINISIRLANSSGVTKYCYIKTMVLVEEGTVEVQPSPLSYLSGLCGTALASVGGTVIPLSGWKSDMYEVIVTPKSTATAYVTKADNQFTITSVGADGNVAYLIIPKCGLLI